MSIQLDPSQKAAVDLICTARIGIVTGGPGTGKTTTTRAALDELDKWGETYRLAAPTGKAARRMSEATGRDAGTIHRLLEWSPMVQGFTRNARNPLDVDCVIVDESSMIDTYLLASLATAIDPTKTRLIFVGDRNQLPSVGPGKVLADMIASEMIPVVELTTLHRAAAESWVCQNAPRVLAGQLPDLASTDDFQWSPAPNAEAAAQAAIGFARSLGAQILTPQRTLACGVNEINRRMQAAVNARRDGEQRLEVKGDPGFEIRPRDRVIQTRNNYELDVMNGEVGTVAYVDKGTVAVDFDDRRVEFKGLDAHGLRLAYALTIHKSQGSEWPWVVVVCHSSHSYMLGRSLLYTAITRAKQGVVIVGDEKGLKRAIENTRDAQRNTTLAARMQHYAAHGAEGARA